VNDDSISHVTLDQVRWAEDLAVSGNIEKPMSRSGTVRAVLHLAAADGLTGDLTVDWPEGIANATAGIHGTLGGAAVRARTTAP